MCDNSRAYGPFNNSTMQKSMYQISEVRNPAGKIMFIDESEYTVNDGSWSPNQYDQLSNAHSISIDSQTVVNGVNSGSADLGTGNVCFADGHAGIVSRADSKSHTFFDPNVP
jgi:prepilin-type processing-associated H-X9-DG protein